MHEATLEDSKTLMPRIMPFWDARPARNEYAHPL